LLKKLYPTGRGVGYLDESYKFIPEGGFPREERETFATLRETVPSRGI